jgi:hypothetical protein
MFNASFVFITLFQGGWARRTLNHFVRVRLQKYQIYIKYGTTEVVVYLYHNKDIYTHKGLYHNKDIYTHKGLYNYNDSVSLILIGNRIYTIRVYTQGMEPDSLIFTREQKGSGQWRKPYYLYIYL